MLENLLRNSHSHTHSSSQIARTHMLTMILVSTKVGNHFEEKLMSSLPHNYYISSTCLAKPVLVLFCTAGRKSGTAVLTIDLYLQGWLPLAVMSAVEDTEPGPGGAPRDQLMII